MKTLLTEHLQRDIFADECRTHAVECHELAEYHRESIKEQYETLARQWLMIAAQASPLRM
jgi:hypothetical protein